MRVRALFRFTIASLLLACGWSDSMAQTVGTTIAVGTAPSAITINPITNKIYVANESSNNVTVIDGRTHATTTVAVGTRPLWIAVNTELNKVYVSNFGDTNTRVSPMLTILNGASDTVAKTTFVGDVGWTAVNSVTGKA